jgi:hypothetical protein
MVGAYHDDRRMPRVFVITTDKERLTELLIESLDHCAIEKPGKIAQ